MDQKLLSIYIGADVIRVCEAVKKSSSNVVINFAHEVATPDSAVDDGYIVDVPAVAEAIMSTNMGRRFSAKNVIFTIDSKKVLSKEVVIPYVRGDKKILSIVEANSTDYFPTTAGSRHIFSFRLMETFMDEENVKQLRINATAAPLDLVSSYYRLADELKLNVENIDYVSNSVLSLLSLQLHDTDTNLILQIEKDVTYVNIMSGQDVLLQRVVSFGRNTVVNYIMETKGLERKDASHLLASKESLYSALTPEEYSDILSNLVNSIRRIVEYHITRHQDRIIDSIVIFGEGSAMAEIDEVLQKNLGAEVSRFDTIEGIKVSDKANLSAKKALRYLANFGALFSSRGLAIGNISDDEEEEHPGKGGVIGMLVAFAVVAIVMMGIVAWVEIKYYTEEAVIASLKAEEDELSVYEEYALEYSDLAESYNSVKAFDDSTHSDNTMLLTFIDDLETILPKGVRFERIRSVDGAITFHVVAPSKACVVDMLNQIDEFEYVESVNVPGLEADFLDDDELMEAQVKAQADALEGGATLEESIEAAKAVQSVEVSYDFNCVIFDPFFDDSTVEVLDLDSIKSETGDANMTAGAESIIDTDANVEEGEDNE